ncbi:MAG: glycosyltransferase family 2 protein [Verrucomicrobiales bacterium]
MSRKNKQLLACVATLTRQRPKMLEALLRSWSSLIIPEEVTVTFLVIENDTEERSKDLIQTLHPIFKSSKLVYALETEPGIPFARNHAARESLKMESDILLFVDDDEEVASDWLEKIIQGYRSSKAKLIGAPLRARLPEENLTLLQRLMFTNIKSRYRKKEMRASRRASLEGTSGVTIVTNNWLADTSLFSEHNIWFDESMRHTGGTDSKFCSEVIAQNIPTAWVRDAYVYETIPPERLSFLYQYRRARDQSNTNFRRKNNGTVRLNMVLVTSILIKLIAVVGLILTLPFTAGRTLMTLARALGWIAGRAGAIAGSESNLYSNTTGN